MQHTTAWDVPLINDYTISRTTIFEIAGSIQYTLGNI